MDKTLKTKKILIIAIVILFIFMITLVIASIARKVENDSIEDNLVMVDEVLGAYTIDSDDDILLVDDETIGTLEIPKLNVKAVIKEGTENKVLDKYIGHFTESNIWEGNVALAAHNRGINVKHYFEKINELENGDEVIYSTKLGIRKYQVTKVFEIDSTDWNEVENNESNKNRLTLITCVANHSEKRLCVICEEKNN